MQHFRGGSEFHKYKSILAPDQSQIIFTSIKETNVLICQFMFFYSSFLLYSMFLIII